MAAPPEPPRREATPPTTPDPLAGQWEQLRPQLRSWWDRLTEADLAQIGGQKDRLISAVQQRYGYPRERAQQEVERRLQDYNEKSAGVAATVSSAAQDVASRVTETAGTAAATAQEMAGAAAAAVTDTVAGAGTYVRGKGVQALAGDLAGLIRRYPVPALLIGAGVGVLLGRSLWRTGGPSARGEGQPPGTRMAEAGFLDATIQCVRCGQIVRQADMVSHATTCAVPGLPSQGGARPEPPA
jgi:uncharacterized protein YjbJ (UPF0337 family)